MDRRRALLLLGLGAAAIAGASWMSRRARAAGRRPSRATLPLFYTDAYAGAAMSFETTRKARWVAESLAAAPIRGL
ncbi:MAG: hypothetical protein ABI588_02225, partial [Arenimonas sp.]